MRRLAAVIGISAGALLTSAAPASAVHCYVTDKPTGAGAITFAEALDPNQAGKSGKAYYTGAFVTFPSGDDVFIRGPEEFPGPDVQGTGGLPQQPHDNGSEDHGVNSLDIIE